MIIRKYKTMIEEGIKKKQSDKEILNNDGGRHKEEKKIYLGSSLILVRLMLIWIRTLQRIHSTLFSLLCYLFFSCTFASTAHYTF